MATSNPLVLVVDDEPRMCDVIERILKQEVYKVITAPDGETALRLIPEKKPDVLLLDFLMPGIDGREVCRRVREFSTKIKVIYLTARSKPIDQLELKEFRSEADAFISKPATSRRILSTVSRVLQSDRQ